MNPAVTAEDRVPIITLMAVGILALVASWTLPWWRMEARAPQYGQRVLVVSVNPRGFSGDVAEVDTLGHYVGIQPMASFAHAEQALGPVGLIAAVVGFLAAPFLRKRRWRAAALAAVFVMPLVFVADLAYWTDRGANRRDPTAALNLTVPQIDTKIFGTYSVGQFQIEAKAGAGLFGVATAALLAVGLVGSRPMELKRWRRRGLAVAAFLVASPAARAAELRVAPEASLGEAVARAAPGDTVVVSGMHQEHVVVDRPLVLAGEPGAGIDGAETGTVLVVRGPGVTVRGLTLRASGDSYTQEDAAVRLEETPDVVLADLQIEDTLFGVFALRADRCRLERLHVVGKDLPLTRRGDAIRLWYSSGCAILGNTIERSRDLVIWYSEGTRVEDNVVRDGRYGLHYMYSDHNVFRRNRFEDNQVGAAIMYSRGVELSANTFAFANGPSAHGLLVKDADDIELAGNRFVGNADAMFFDGAPQSRGGKVLVHDNLIASNGVGVTLQPLSRGLELWGNAFVRNGVQVAVAGSGDVSGNLWERDGRGNYWSDAVPYDADGDGVSELPHRLESTYEALADAHPTLAFFAGTPGAEVLDLAARLFPVFAPRPKVVDPHPLTRPTLQGWAASAEVVEPGRLALASAALLAAAALALGGARRVLP